LIDLSFIRSFFFSIMTINSLSNSKEIEMNFQELIELYPILKQQQQDRIRILICGKEFHVQNRQVNIETCTKN